jgi:N-acyl-phosphatidylethanolamine-hydrolysing phospholipase D
MKRLILKINIPCSMLILCMSMFLFGCNPFVNRFIAKSFEGMGATIDSVANKIEHPILPHVGLSVLWVGHSTFLIQIGDKAFLTDPVFTNTVGLIMKRKVEAGILPSSINKLDYILISHLHFDHLNFGSLNDLPKTAALLLPPGGIQNTPEFGFSDYKEMEPWSVFDADGVKITAVPVKHFNGRYGFDNGWLNYNTYTGYIIEYQGKTIFFAGDTGYDPEKFKTIGEKFRIDVALIPIAPIEPRDFMRRVHTDPKEALQVFDEVKAKIMVPMHHLTFVQGLDSTLTLAQDQLSQLAAERHLEDRVLILKVGEQRILEP